MYLRKETHDYTKDRKEYNHYWTVFPVDQAKENKTYKKLLESKVKLNSN